MLNSGKLVITQLLATVLYSVLPVLSAYPVDGPKMRPYSTGTIPALRPLLYSPNQLANYRSILSNNNPTYANAKVQPSSLYNYREPMSSSNDLFLFNDYYGNQNQINDNVDYEDDYADDGTRLDENNDKWYDVPIGRPNFMEPVDDRQITAEIMLNYLLNTFDKDTINSALNAERMNAKSSKFNDDETMEKRSSKKQTKEESKQVSVNEATSAPKSTQQPATTTTTTKTSVAIPSKVQRGQKEFPMYRSAERDDRFQPSSISDDKNEFAKQSNWPPELENVEEQSLRSLRSVNSITRNVRDVWASELESLRQAKTGDSSKIKH